MVDLPLTATDLRQFLYCPRVVYFTHVQPLERPVTYKMQHGLTAEERVVALEKRRTLRRYDIPEGERLFDVWLADAARQLTGRADMLIVAPDRVVPVEFKETDEGLSHNHRLQVTAYALMAEAQFGRPAPEAFIVHLAAPSLVKVSCGEAWRRRVDETLAQIREMADSERFPDPPRGRGKCRECEFRRFCGDV